VADFPEKVVPVLQRRIARYPNGEIRFNLMAVVKDLRIKAEEIGDQEALERERRKRREWEWENSLRRWNFVGFIGEVLRGVVKGKVKEGAYDAWIEEAKGRTAKRMEERKKRGVGEEELVE
jgi:ubiquitin carboxyl-terminal hydrolase L5